MRREQLVAQIKAKGSFLCVGLDPDLDRMPGHLKEDPEGVLDFCKAIVDATRPYAVAYKPNTAFFEVFGPTGWLWFDELIHYIGHEHFIIADAKRGDIGNTSKQYARTFFETYPCDAVTVAPYMGRDSVVPFLEFPGKWAIVLALTSNAGAADFQMQELSSNNEPLYRKLLEEAVSWTTQDRLMFVVGATRAEMLADVRKIAPAHFLLVPGIGAQGGSLAEVCEYGLNKDIGLLVNASRSILYASRGYDFAVAAGNAAKEIAADMNEILKKKCLL